ncbi:MAG: ABC transporter permease [Oscillospiraceae bacterium]|nr:ABC transporter permease [Oscillospiraceae bacterium]
MALSKLSGGTAKELTRFTFKYWRKHKKSLAALLFSGVLLCAVVCCALLMLRQTFNRKIESMYDTIGHFEFMTTADRQDFIAAFTGDDTVTGKMDVMGTMGIGNMKFEYGILDDPHNLSHIPLEAGHMPREKGEIMIDRGVLDKLGFFGGVGDTIELDKGKYTIVGVTAKDKSSGRSIYGYRQGSVLNQLENAESNYYASDDDKKISEHNILLIFISEKENQEPLYTWVMLYNIRGVDHKTTDKDKIYSLNINKHLQKEGLQSIPAGNFPLFERVLDTV